jgi:lipopolysaccharide export system protein LptA
VLLTGNVKITQAEMTLTAAAHDGHLYRADQSGSPQVSRLDAAGGVTVSRPDQTARSQYAVYDLNRRVITMIGGVTLRQGANNSLGRAPVDRSGHRPRDDRRFGRARRRYDEPGTCRARAAA